MTDEDMSSEDGSQSEPEQLNLLDPVNSVGRNMPALEKDFFRADRSLLLAPSLFVLHPDHRQKVISTSETHQTVAKITYTTQALVNGQECIFDHPPLGVDEQRLITGLTALAQGDLRGSRWSFNSDDPSEQGQRIWKQFGEEAKQPGGVVMVLRPTRRQLVEAAKPHRSPKSINHKDVLATMESLRLLSRVHMTVKGTTPDGEEYTTSDPLIFHIDNVGENITIVLNPKIATSLMGYRGSFSMLSLEELRSLKNDPAHLLYNALAGRIDPGTQVKYGEEKLEEYIYGNVLPGTVENKAAIKNRKRTIKNAISCLQDTEIGKTRWKFELEKNFRTSNPSWIITRGHLSSSAKLLLTSRDEVPGSDKDTGDIGSKTKPNRPSRGRYKREPK